MLQFMKKTMAATRPIHTASYLSAIIDSIPTAVVVSDFNGVIILVNRQVEALFGYGRTEILGEPIEVLIPHRFRAGHPALRGRFLLDPRARPMGEGRDLFALRRDGTEFPVEIGLNPIPTDESVFVVSAIIDISERKRLEARFRATVESAPTGMVMIDEAGTILLANAEANRLFGYSETDLLGQKIEALIPEAYRAQHPFLRSQYFASPEPRRMGAGRDLFGLRADQSEFPVEIGLNPINTDEGSFVLAAIVDLTERKRIAEADLRRANEALERSNLELQRFAHVVSHDLQSPLRSIGSFVDLLSTSYGNQFDDRAGEWMRRIVRSVKQLQDLIRDLLQYSRVDLGASSFQEVPLQNILEQALLLLEAPIREAKAEVLSGSLPIVRGDSSQLVQLLANLLSNALKYRGSQALRIQLLADSVEGEWRIGIRDNGIGIARRHQEQIFEAFKRLHNQSQYPGSGIGLAICRRVVESHGGRIWVESEVDKGSTFYFTLPRREELLA